MKKVPAEDWAIADAQEILQSLHELGEYHGIKLTGRIQLMDYSFKEYPVAEINCILADGSGASGLVRTCETHEQRINAYQGTIVEVSHEEGD